MTKNNRPRLKDRFRYLLEDDFTRHPDSDDSGSSRRIILVSRWGDLLYKVLSVVATLMLIGVLLLAVAHSPEYGDPNNPAMNEVAHRYVVEGTNETGATNTVAGMILDYRAFDTFGEALMMFTSAMAVVMLLRETTKKERDRLDENN